MLYIVVVIIVAIVVVVVILNSKKIRYVVVHVFIAMKDGPLNYLSVPMYCLISRVIVVVIRLDEFVFVDSAAKTQKIRNLILRLLEYFRDHR